MGLMMTSVSYFALELRTGIAENAMATLEYPVKNNYVEDL